VFKCLSCREKVTLEQMQEKIRCPYCGYRILTKARPDVVTKVKTI